MNPLSGSKRNSQPGLGDSFFLTQLGHLTRVDHRNALGQVARPADCLRLSAIVAKPRGEVFLASVLACNADHFRASDMALLIAYSGAVVKERVASGVRLDATYPLRVAVRR